MISKRSKLKDCKERWETMGGMALAGENCLDAALREVKEEVGLSLKSENGKLISKKKYNDINYLCCIWLFKQNFNIENLICQNGEVSEIKKIKKEKLTDLINSDDFFEGEIFEEIIDELLRT